MFFKKKGYSPKRGGRIMRDTARIVYNSKKNTYRILINLEFDSNSDFISFGYLEDGTMAFMLDSEKSAGSLNLKPTSGGKSKSIYCKELVVDVLKYYHKSLTDCSFTVEVQRKGKIYVLVGEIN
jgi:hypothetical protein